MEWPDVVYRLWGCDVEGEWGLEKDARSLEKLVAAKPFNVNPLTRSLLCLQPKTVVTLDLRSVVSIISSASCDCPRVAKAPTHTSRAAGRPIVVAPIVYHP